MERSELSPADLVHITSFVISWANKPIYGSTVYVDYSTELIGVHSIHRRSIEGKE